MAAFDPYHVWLGIPPKDQPPDYYRLLGISLFESDPDIIEKAADRQTIFVRQFLAGEHAEEASRLLQEINAAKIVLLNPESKAAYDAQLSQAGISIDADRPLVRRRSPVRSLLGVVTYLWTHPNVTASLAAVIILIVAAVLVIPAIQGPAMPGMTATNPSTDTGGSEGGQAPATPREGNAPGDAGATPNTGSTAVAGESSGEASQLPSGSAAGTENGGTPESGVPTESGPPSVVPTPGGTLPGGLNLPPVPGVDPAHDFDRPGMIGRMVVGSTDAGVVLRYQPGNSFNESIVKQCLRQFGLPETDERRLQLEAIVRVSRTTTALVQLVGDGSVDTVSAVYLDGALLAQAGSQYGAANASRRVFTQGDHYLQWMLAGSDFGSQQQLTIRALESPSALPEETPPDASAGESPEDGSGALIAIVYDNVLLAKMHEAATIGRVEIAPGFSLLTPEQLAQGTAGQPTETEPASPEEVVAGGKQPVPDLAAIDAARLDIHGVFEKEYRDARSSTEARALLARTLLKEAAETGDNPAVRYTLYDEARTLAVDGEAPSLAIEAVDSMGLYFDVDTWQLHVETVEQLAKEVGATKARDELVQLVDRLIDSAIDADRYDVVPPLVKAGAMTATKLRDLALRDYLEAKQERAKQIEQAYLQAKAALAQLVESPDDPNANTIAGAFYCFAKRQWTRGLPMLVKGDNAMMKTVAQADLAKPTSPRSQLQLADDWWALADTLEEPLKSGARRRAGWWYILAGPQLRGEELERARERAVESGRIIDLLDLAMKRKALMLGSWQRVGGLVSSLEPAPRVQFNVFAPDRYRLDLVIEPLAAAGKEEDREKLPGREGFIVGLPWRNYWFTAVLDWSLGRQGNAAFLALYDGKGPDSSNPTFRPNKLLRSKRPNYVSYEVTADGVTVMVNRIPIIQYTDSYDHLKMPPEWAVPGKRRIFIGTRFCSYRITKADLIDLDD